MNFKKNLAVPGDTSPCTRVPRDKSEKKFRRKNPKIMKNVFFESVILAEVCRFKKKFKSKKSYLDKINSMTSSPGKQGRFCPRVLRDGFIFDFRFSLQNSYCHLRQYNMYLHRSTPYLNSIPI